MRKFISILLFLLFFINSTAHAQTLDEINLCTEQKVAAKRLNCFDSLVIKVNKEFRDKTNREREEAERKVVRDREEAEKKAVRDREEAERQVKQKEDDLKKAENEKILSSARRMLSALKRLETRVETGVSYRDYPSIVSDADFEVKQFSNEFGPRLPDVGLNALKAMSDYQYVLAVWRMKFNQSSPSGRRPNEWVHEQSQIQAVLSAYPSAYSARLSDGTLSIDRVLSIVWAEGSKKIKDVEQALSEANSKK